MTRADQERLLDFLRRKQCAPCRRGQLDLSHSGCVEAEELIELVQNEPTKS